MIPIPRIWSGKTAVCLGGGPSLTVEDVTACSGIDVCGVVPNWPLRVIAINDAYKLAPWADALYAADRKWIDWHDGVPSFSGQKYTIQSNDTTTRPDWMVLRNTGYDGLETEPGGLRTGFNSGYQAINLAVQLGAKRILLLGYDMAPAIDGKTHWFGDHPDKVPSPYDQMRAAFDTLVEPLAALGVDVINCSRHTALLTFPCFPLSAVLRERAA